MNDTILKNGIVWCVFVEDMHSRHLVGVFSSEPLADEYVKKNEVADASVGITYYSYRVIPRVIDAPGVLV